MSLLTSPRKSLILLATSSLLLSACASQPQNFQDLTAQSAQEDHLTQLSTWIFPAPELETARKAFVQRCVEASGGHYLEPENRQSLETAVYTGPSLQALKETGYQAPAPQDAPQAFADYNQVGLEAYLGQGGEDFTVSFMDYSSGSLNSAGCQSQSYRYIYGSAEDGIKQALLAPLFAQSIGRALKEDDQYQGLQEDWSTCLAEEGFTVASSDQAAYAASQLGAEEAKKLLARDISCREKADFDAKLTDLKSSYLEAVYQRLKPFKEDFERIQQTAAQKLEEDKANPQTTSPVTALPTPSGTPSAEATSS